ncbi:MAG: ATP-binding protein, partial [Pseudomonadota bacterium]
LAEDVVSASRELHAKRRNVAVSFSREPKTGNGFFVAGHGTRLGQVINNLIDNAVSFVSEHTGKVDVYLSLENQDLLMIVEDNGPGINAEDVDRIFERFYTDRADTDGFGQNSGLGLSISRQIIEAHGGTIHAENRTGATTGARFIVKLPLEPVSK